MVKNNSIIPFMLFCLTLLYSFPTIVLANNTILSDSVITLPIEADLKMLEEHLNTMVPQMLTEINEPNKVCLEAQYLRTKGIPKCRRDGYKISCKNRWIKLKTVPQINCNISGWVKRDGRISLSGKGKTLTFSFPVKAKVSTDAGIRETAVASAVLHISATPNIHKDWSVSVDLMPHFVWTEEPNLKLLNVVKVNLKNKLEPKLRKKLHDFVKKVPTLLADLGMKEKIDTVWKEIQKPIKIDNNSETYLLFAPKSASYSGFNIVNNVLKTTIRTQGSTKIIVGKPEAVHQNNKLCDLHTLSCQKGDFNFNLPVSVTYQELLHLSSKVQHDKLSIEPFKSTLPGVLKISSPSIEKSHNGHINITAHVTYDHRSSWLKAIDLFDWFKVDGKITFKALPTIDKVSRTIVLKKLVYDSSTNSKLFDLLVEASELDPIKSHFTSLLKYEFGPKIDAGIVKANEALHTLSTGDINISANLKIASIEDIKVDDKHITIHTKLSGKVNARLGL